MISVVTGTYNRVGWLSGLIENTVGNSERLELVLVDGGSTDGTIDYVKSLDHPRIKLVEVGKRSSYPHFMNLGIENSTHELVAQWNDDVILMNDWEDVFAEIDDENDFYIFSWGRCQGRQDGPVNEGEKWILLESKSDLVMNYGVYRKKIFREIGMYCTKFAFYYADGDMSYRAKCFGYPYKALSNIKVCSMVKAFRKNDSARGQQNVYNDNKRLYEALKLPDGIDYLK